MFLYRLNTIPFSITAFFKPFKTKYNYLEPTSYAMVYPCNLLRNILTLHASLLKLTFNVVYFSSDFKSWINRNKYFIILKNLLVYLTVTVIYIFPQTIKTIVYN